MYNEQLLSKLEFLSLYRLAREYYTLKELSSILNIDIPTLSKYTTGKILPSMKRIREIIPKLLELVDPLREIKATLISGSFTFPELNNVLNTKPYLLLWILVQTLRKLNPREFDKILTVEGGGLVYATFLAMFTNKKVVYGIRDTFIEGGLSEPYRTPDKESYSPKMNRYITIPKGGIKRGDRVIIVDDISWTGGTIYTLYNLVKSLEARLIHIYIIAIFKDTLEKLQRKIGNKITPLIVLPR
ncbi:MAG: phosphoribosyltransferase family protein [Thermoprotei archaeon]